MKTQSLKLFDMPGRYKISIAWERIRGEAALRYSVTSLSQLVPRAHAPPVGSWGDILRSQRQSKGEGQPGEVMDKCAARSISGAPLIYLKHATDPWLQQHSGRRQAEPTVRCVRPSASHLGSHLMLWTDIRFLQWIRSFRMYLYFWIRISFSIENVSFACYFWLFALCDVTWCADASPA